MEASFVVFAGTKVAALLGPGLIASRYIGEVAQLKERSDGGTSTFPGDFGQYKQGEKMKIPGYSVPMQKKVTYVGDMQPKFHEGDKSLKFVTGSCAWSRGSYKPKYLRDANRSEWHDDAQSFNALDGSMNSINFYENNKRLKQQMIDGEFIQGPTGSRIAMSELPYKLRPYKQITATALLERTVDGEMAEFNKKHYKLTSEEYIALGRWGFYGLRNKRSPGWRSDLYMMSYGWPSYKGLANANATIYRLKNHAPNLETPMKDMGFSVCWDTGTPDRYKVFAPFFDNGRQPDFANGIAGGDGDSLTTMRSISLGYNFNATPTVSARHNPMNHYNTLQAAVRDMESLGVNFEVELLETGVNSFPVSRHKLYTDNFPYRGNVKKPVGVKGWKRQKGGDAPRVIHNEFHAQSYNHFDNTSKDELFA